MQYPLLLFLCNFSQRTQNQHMMGILCMLVCMYHLQNYSVEFYEILYWVLIKNILEK